MNNLVLYREKNLFSFLFSTLKSLCLERKENFDGPILGNVSLLADSSLIPRGSNRLEQLKKGDCHTWATHTGSLRVRDTSWFAIVKEPP